MNETKFQERFSRGDFIILRETYREGYYIKMKQPDGSYQRREIGAILVEHSEFPILDETGEWIQRIVTASGRERLVKHSVYRLANLNEIKRAKLKKIFYAGGKKR